MLNFCDICDKSAVVNISRQILIDIGEKMQRVNLSPFPHSPSISSHPVCKDAASHATLIGRMTNIKKIAMFNCSSNSLFQYLDLLGALLKVGESPPGDVNSGSCPSQLESDP